MKTASLKRRSIRLKRYDYSHPGYYFITICTQNRTCLFGDIIVGAGPHPYYPQPKMELNEFGKIVDHAWYDLPNHYSNVKLDQFVILPNHVHGIIILQNSGVGAGLKPAPTNKVYRLSEIIRGFKTFSAKRINQIRSTPGQPLWQRNYYEHVIRDEQELLETRQYIQNNPKDWAIDPENIHHA